MILPKHINLEIEHNPHKTDYETAEQYIKKMFSCDCWDIKDFISEEDKAECVKNNDFWTLHWYPDTPVGFCTIIASTLEKALERAND